MQVKSAAGGNSWIPAIGVSVGVFDGEDARVQQGKDSCTPLPGTGRHQAQVAGASGHGEGTRCGPVPASRWEEAGDG